MANIKSQMKRNRQNEKRRIHNRIYRSSTRTYIQKANIAIAGGDKAASEAAVKQAIEALDKAAQKKVLHKNNAARRKSRLLKRFASAQK